MTRAQRSHDDALGKPTTPFSDSGARRDLIQNTKKNAPPFLVERSLRLAIRPNRRHNYICVLDQRVRQTHLPEQRDQRLRCSSSRLLRGP